MCLGSPWQYQSADVTALNQTVNASLVQMCYELLGLEASTAANKMPPAVTYDATPRGTSRRSVAFQDGGDAVLLKITAPMFTDSDRRPSAIAIGSLGAICAATPFVLFFLMDIPVLFHQFKIMLRNLGTLRKRSENVRNSLE